MPIRNVRLKNFTVFSDIAVDLGNGINVFIGQNGTGKTHLLKMIYAGCEVTKSNSTLGFGDYFQCGNPFLHMQHNDSCKITDIYISSHDTDKIRRLHHSNGTLKIDGLREIPVGKEYIFHLPSNDTYNAIFIPSKDMLTHAKGLLAMKEKYRGFPFDKTLTDIISRANQWSVKQVPEIAISILPQLERIMNGEVMIENEEFFIQKRDGKKISFALEAEGIKKAGLLWQLLMNENITKDSILLWDEPEANLNPEYLPLLVECLLELSRHNVQILVSTHNYIFAKYFDVKKTNTDRLAFHALYKEDKTIHCETKTAFSDLEHNEITNTFDRLLDEVYDLGVGE